MKTYQVDENGYYGEFGGAYVPEILHQCVENLQKKYLEVLESDSFKKEFNQLLRDYVGRPSPLYQAKRLSEMYGCKIYLKREDLNHTGAHKINNTIGQILFCLSFVSAQSEQALGFLQQHIGITVEGYIIVILSLIHI